MNVVIYSGSVCTFKTEGKAVLVIAHSFKSQQRYYERRFCGHIFRKNVLEMNND